MSTGKKKELEERIAGLDIEPIDFNDTDKLVKDIWLFLTNDKMPLVAKIKREALYHEAACMIDAAKEFCSRERSIEFAHWMLKNKASSFGFEIKWSISGSDKIYSTMELYHLFLDQTQPQSTNETP